MRQEQEHLKCTTRSSLVCYLFVHNPYNPFPSSYFLYLLLLSLTSSLFGTINNTGDVLHSLTLLERSFYLIFYVTGSHPGRNSRHTSHTPSPITICPVPPRPGVSGRLQRGHTTHTDTLGLIPSWVNTGLTFLLSSWTGTNSLKHKTDGSVEPKCICFWLNRSNKWHSTLDWTSFEVLPYHLRIESQM